MPGLTLVLPASAVMVTSCKKLLEDCQGGETAVCDVLGGVSKDSRYRREVKEKQRGKMELHSGGDGACLWDEPAKKEDQRVSHVPLNVESGDVNKWKPYLRKDIYCCKSTIAAEKDSGKETENKSADAEKGSEKEAGSGAAKPDAELTNAARRYLLALALLAENYPRSTGSYRLRSGCELLAAAKKEEVLGAGSDSEHAKALIGLCGDRELLIKVAQAAHVILNIPKNLSTFESNKEDLKGDLEKAGKKAAKQNKGGGKGGKSKGAADATTGAETLSDSTVESHAASNEIP